MLFTILYLLQKVTVFNVQRLKNGLATEKSTSSLYNPRFNPNIVNLRTLFVLNIFYGTHFAFFSFSTIRTVAIKKCYLKPNLMSVFYLTPRWTCVCAAQSMKVHLTPHLCVRQEACARLCSVHDSSQGRVPASLLSCLLLPQESYKDIKLFNHLFMQIHDQPMGSLPKIIFVRQLQWGFRL